MLIFHTSAYYKAVSHDIPSPSSPCASTEVEAGVERRVGVERGVEVERGVGGGERSSGGERSQRGASVDVMVIYCVQEPNLVPESLTQH